MSDIYDNENPRRWSVLACAVVNRYYQDLQNGFKTKEDIKDPTPEDWIECLTYLGQRYRTFVKDDDLDEQELAKKVAKLYKNHTQQEICKSFGISSQRLDSLLRKFNIKKTNKEAQ